MNDIGMQFQLPLSLPENLSQSRNWRGTTNTEADGVYGWYRYIQDFTGDFAEKWISKTFSEGSLVWDPFVGSGTTIVACQKLGIDSVGYDANPFMIEVVHAKTDWGLSPVLIEEELHSILAQAKNRFGIKIPKYIAWSDYEPLMEGRNDFHGDPKLRKWIAPSVAEEIRWLVSEIEKSSDARVKRFLRLAVASIIIPASNMILKPNISYRSKATVEYPVVEHFEARCRAMIAEYRNLTQIEIGSSKVELGDARTAGPHRADGIFTSPPYPNDMEYVHQTRLELALLNHTSDKKELTALKKRMVSSSVKLVYRENEWQKAEGMEVDAVRCVYTKIAETLVGRNWGWNPADMVAQYFGGMRAIMRNWHQRLAPNAIAAVVVGDSAFNGIKVATDELLARCGEMEGFAIEDISVFRQRWNSKHEIELRESVVVLRNKGIQ
ncbi:DNA methyltransferase [Mesorhizobium sp. A623]